MQKKVRGISKPIPEVGREIYKANLLPQLWDEPMEQYIENESNKEKNLPPDRTKSGGWLERRLGFGSFGDSMRAVKTPEERVRLSKLEFAKLVSELPREFLESQKMILAVVEGKTIPFNSDLKKRKEKIFHLIYDSDDYKSREERGRWIEFYVDSNGNVSHINPLIFLESAVTDTVHLRETFIEVIGWNKRYSKSFDGTFFPGRSFISFSVKDGFLDLRYSNPLLNLLKDLKVDTSRIGKCPTCKKIFWKQREDATACSRPCANKFHQKAFQSDESKRAALNLTRQENYRRRKKIEEIKKKNGTL